MLLQYADGLLDPAHHAKVKHALAANPDLRARLEALEATAPDADMWRVFDAPMNEPVPQHLVDLVMHGPGKSVEPSASQSPATPGIVARLRGFLFPSGGFGAPALAFSALITVGVAAAALLYANRAAEVDPQTAAVLETRPSGPFDGRVAAGAIVPTGTFESTDGSICRRYAVAAKGADLAYAAVACRQPSSGKWIARVRGPVAPDQSTGVVPSSGPDTAAFDAAMKRLMADDLMMPADEKRLMERSWKK